MPYLLALVLCLLSWSSQAATTLEEAIEVFHQGRFSEAKTALKPLEEHAEAHYYLARIAINDDLDQAEEHIERAIELAPDEARYHSLCGQIMADQASDAFFSALGYAKASKRCFQRAAELAPDDPLAQIGLIQFFAQAPGIAGGDEDEAMAMIASLADQYPGHAASQRISLMDDDERDAAMAAALQAHPNNAVLLFQQGLRQQRKGDHTAAIASFEQIIQNQPDSGAPYHNALYQLARSALLSGEQQQRGIETMQQYLALPRVPGRLAENYWAHLRLAQLLLAEGLEEQARAHLSLAQLSEDSQLREAMREAGL
jgi:tetratricopeptide (TPR) repeat protein